MGIFWQAKPVLLHRCENVPACAVGEGGRKIFRFAVVTSLDSLCIVASWNPPSCLWLKLNSLCSDVMK